MGAVAKPSLTGYFRDRKMSATRIGQVLCAAREPLLQHIGPVMEIGLGEQLAQVAARHAQRRRHLRETQVPFPEVLVDEPPGPAKQC
jgi:hypothetical protein